VTYIQTDHATPSVPSHGEGQGGAYALGRHFARAALSWDDKNFGTVEESRQVHG